MEEMRNEQMFSCGVPHERVVKKIDEKNLSSKEITSCGKRKREMKLSKERESLLVGNQKCGRNLTSKEITIGLSSHRTSAATHQHNLKTECDKKF